MEYLKLDQKTLVCRTYLETKKEIFCLPFMYIFLLEKDGSINNFLEINKLFNKLNFSKGKSTI